MNFIQKVLHARKAKQIDIESYIRKEIFIDFAPEKLVEDFADSSKNTIKKSCKIANIPAQVRTKEYIEKYGTPDYESIIKRLLIDLQGFCDCLLNINYDLHFTENNMIIIDATFSLLTKKSDFTSAVIGAIKHSICESH